MHLRPSAVLFSILLAVSVQAGAIPADSGLLESRAQRRDIGAGASHVQAGHTEEHPREGKEHEDTSPTWAKMPPRQVLFMPNDCIACMSECKTTMRGLSTMTVLMQYEKCTDWCATKKNKCTSTSGLEEYRRILGVRLPTKKEGEEARESLAIRPVVNPADNDDAPTFY
ncbi:hypothetical protein F5B20DRAFT_584037 [Whalleya microplaca]|nr:hypothetical protein F5B20DRAFT_584037 [Whalleya microplaca]